MTRYSKNLEGNSVDDNSVDSQPGHVTPESQSRSLCAGSDTSCFESVDSDKEGT